MLETRHDQYIFSGMNTNVNMFAMKDDELLLALNWYTKIYGAKKVRFGYAKFLDQIDNQPVRNLIYFNFPNGQKGIIRISNKNTYRYSFSGGTWGSNLKSWTVDTVTGNTILAGTVTFLHLSNGTDDYTTYDGASFATLTTGNTPLAKYLTSWNSRVFAANYHLHGTSATDAPKSFLLQSAVDFDLNYTDPWAEVATDPATAGHVGVDIGLGTINGISVSVDRINIYKDIGVYKYNLNAILKMPFNSTILTPSTNSDGNIDYFLSPSGIMRNDGNSIQLQSFKINNIIFDTFQNLGISNPVTFSFNHMIFVYVGSIYYKSPNGLAETIPNAMFVYNELYDEWFIWSLGHNMTAFGWYVDPTTNQKVMISGDVNGNTYVWGEQYTDDAGVSIAHRLRTRYFDWGSPESTKIIARYSLSTNPGCEADIRIATDYTDNYKTIDMQTGILTKDLADPSEILDFKTMSLEIGGSTADSKPELFGFTFKEKDQEERLQNIVGQRGRV